jgi:hypothetical protein
MKPRRTTDRDRRLDHTRSSRAHSGNDGFSMSLLGIFVELTIWHEINEVQGFLVANVIGQNELHKWQRLERSEREDKRLAAVAAVVALLIEQRIVMTASVAQRQQLFFVLEWLGLYRYGYVVDLLCIPIVDYDFVEFLHDITRVFVRLKLSRRFQSGV